MNTTWKQFQYLREHDLQPLSVEIQMILALSSLVPIALREFFAMQYYQELS